MTLNVCRGVEDYTALFKMTNRETFPNEQALGNSGKGLPFTRQKPWCRSQLCVGGLLRQPVGLKKREQVEGGRRWWLAWRRCSGIESRRV